MSEAEIYKWGAYAVPFILMAYFMFRRRRRTQKNIQILTEAKTAGLTEPASLHPVIDPADCMGCGACVTACPEGNVLGLIRGKAQLINPTHCIGHGACRVACPFDAITLVCGTSKRGMDIPLVKENFETSVPGIYITGELGGMGLIRNAVEQGRQAMEHMAKYVSKHQNSQYDVVIIGAGPAGYAATLVAHRKKLKYLALVRSGVQRVIKF